MIFQVSHYRGTCPRQANIVQFRYLNAAFKRIDLTYAFCRVDFFFLLVVQFCHEVHRLVIQPSSFVKSTAFFLNDLPRFKRSFPLLPMHSPTPLVSQSHLQHASMLNGGHNTRTIQGSKRRLACVGSDPLLSRPLPRRAACTDTAHPAFHFHRCPHPPPLLFSRNQSSSIRLHDFNDGWRDSFFNIPYTT